MIHPSPHSFSRSPVEEVVCCCTLGHDGEALSLRIPGPYPGWPQIRERVMEMIAGVEDVSRISGCMLRYTDLIPVPHGSHLPGIKEIEQIFSGEFNCYTLQDRVVLSHTPLPGSSGSIRSLHHRPGKPGWTLVLSMQTTGTARFASCDSVMEWFDDARACIHDLFDRIVPEDIVQKLR
ncbi:MAG TPA: TIGR04255 family protein [Methanolinea sp.]|nr:TIGR04255 family protein [Methanolinea sp.]HQK56100.1 TIGR04255 family protein [Methanolinea sp.]